MKSCNNTSQYQQQQRAHPAKHQLSHTTLIATDSTIDNNNKKLVLILATTTPAIDWLKATLALIPHRMQSQETCIRRPRWN